MTTLFISDLHLTDSRPAITALFYNFLEHEARGADALYILGDFFEYWIGDDAIEQPQYRPIVRRLRAIAEGGTPIFFMHGNRDFLVGDGFARASGCRLLSDPTVIDLYGTRTLLMHGDSLCTDDTEHMAFRKMTRDEKWQREVLAKPLAEREAMAKMYREQSGASMSQKTPEIMDVTPSAVIDALRTHGVRHLIHGHTHRPGEHVFDLDDARATRTVLGDWYTQGSVLRVSASTRTLDALPLKRVDASSSTAAGQVRRR